MDQSKHVTMEKSLLTVTADKVMGQVSVFTDGLKGIEVKVRDKLKNPDERPCAVRPPTLVGERVLFAGGFVVWWD